MSYKVRKDYRFACTDNYCDCGGVHHSTSRRKAVRNGRGEPETIWTVIDGDQRTVIADCYTEATAKLICLILNTRATFR